ncbi:bifunctional UDP-N-acetylmuramoyl-tripeptide:D-alanyl-D-alanine ligase/alanine racemase [Paraflavitalea sp. CAU 1676]|uniref:bifunctional UDP-N-acetylmuramoyl-tripeptide:D-alanyl-D-alanine ligase/alanine racemase n=1 Tax=Paraflavitalea sp. CAU 1676 TaxID=3032598 RepID=UPI0023D9E6A8|nr:bifunctional UDP-N-acetylmuramoyl-tripeptide:D-alanyl-D-alanine ligase/alanine racemase [Paraflavitalea sp. CAU 1676]MDF2187284.1 bifunctional UDP-N-acetylmuramoyl-tripeptide:D-alanyl-D-alanine ligase/alanine racemase [Paraflavitalea sp. CAU 1676]
MKYHIEDITGIVKGKLVQQHDNAFIEHLLIDSRKMIFPDTSLFFAMKGPRRDGHVFLPALYEKGVRNFVVSEDTDASKLSQANIIQVKDVLQALQLLAAHHRKQYSLPVIGITGSNGKTIVKEWLNQLLDDQYSIIRSPRSYNSQIGVPLSVWPMNDTHELGIFEAGISQSGEMDRLQKIIQPSIGVFTNIGEAHSEGFLNRRQKVNEKLRLFTHVKTLVYCKDAPEINEGVAALWQQFNKGGQGSFEIFNWSTVTEATLQVLTVYKEEGTTLITALYKEQTIAIKIPFTDDASVENAIHCWCVLLHLGVAAKAIAKKMLQLGPVAMRLELKKGMNNCSIINDSYSADLSSFNIALDFLAQQSQHDRKTVILSDILQSGRNEKELYKEVAQALAQRGIARLIGIGEKMIQHQAVFRLSPIPELVFYPSVESFIHDFHHLSFRDETILLKGARVFELEQIDRLLEQKVHQTVLEIDLNALGHNLRQYQQLLQPTTKLMAMVKAFSYGSGSYEIANALQFHKVDYLAVAYADEGVELRRGGINLPIMVMNADPSTFDVLVQYNLEPDLYSPALLRSFEAFLKRQGIRQFPVHIELETGMNRLGFSPEELDTVLEVLKGDLFIVKSVYSHLAASEDPQHDAYTRRQASIFHGMVEKLQQVITYPFLRHISNTAGIARHPDLQLDMVRLGIGLYGIDSANTHRLELKEVSTLIATIAQIKHLKAGDTVSYGRRGVVERDTLVATVRIGYADGYPRNLSNGVGKMWVNGKLAPVIGTVCMDMVMIDITGIPHVQEGDDVILFGKELPVGQVAHWAQTIPYEMLTGISQRVKRVYFEE